jgi:hypothetical protein
MKIEKVPVHEFTLSSTSIISYVSHMCLNCNVWTCVDFALSSLVYQWCPGAVRLPSYLEN